MYRCSPNRRFCLYQKPSDQVYFSPAGSPVITEEPEDIVVERKSTANLKCQASGSPKPEITWLHNGKRIFQKGQANDKRRFKMDNGNLHFIRIISRKDQTDGGIYQCVATNSLGSAYSRNATLVVGGEYYRIRNVGGYALALFLPCFLCPS